MKSSSQPDQRRRLSRFVDLARVYRGWSRTELSRMLGRDPSKLVPESGNPKLDLIVGLADALDWNIGDVAESVWERDAEPGDAIDSGNFEALSAQAIESRHAGRFDEALAVTRRMRDVAENPRQHAITCLREGSIWDRRGRYARALECAQEGLSMNCSDIDIRTTLQGRLANAHYALWHLVEAKSVARDLIERLEEADLRDPVLRDNLAIGHYAYGHASRRLLESNDSEFDGHAEAALKHLRRAASIYLDLHRTRDRPTDLALARICSGGILEVESAVERRSATDALDEIFEELDLVVDLDTCPSIDLLEARGWWAIFGCNIALRHLPEAELHRSMAVLTNKAMEIAERLGNWGLRERAFTLEHFRRQRI
ncbi:MAG: hypothetical protein VX672_10220, partial [Planctomycetota bacterium]|nr:hypothetical protein [Planctomycetota bacterium]